VEHSKGDDGESVVAIPRFPCGRSMLVKDLELCTDRMSGFMGLVSRVAFVTTWSNRISLLHVVLLVLEGE
jgi:hypothetical protein